MAIVRSELLMYKAKESTDNPTNGGRMSSTATVSGLASNILPRVNNAERLAGSTKYRKVFYKAASADDVALVNTRVYVENYTPGDDSVVLFLGTQTDTQTDITGSETLYGCGQLNATVLAGVTSIDVAVEDWTQNPIFANGQFVRISDMADIDATGNEEIVLLDAAPSAAGDVITLSFTPALSNGYTDTATRVASILDVDDALGDLITSYNTFTVASVGTGDYDDTTYPITLDSIATVYEAWTLNFTSATAFDVVGDTLGVVGAGNVSGGAAPTNADFGAPYFTLPSTGFSGTWQSGDTISFTTVPQAVPLWLKRIVPAGAASTANNKAIIVMDGESA